MDYTFLERLKSRVLSGAQTSAARIEEAARTGKLHLDLMAERRKLIRAYTELGKEAHTALLEGSIGAFMGRAGVTELQTEIARHEQEITALEAKLAQLKKEKASR
jgi:cell division septum initiation protein DivIVA